MKNLGYIELLVRFPNGTQIMGNAKGVSHVTSSRRRRNYLQTYLHEIMQVGIITMKNYFVKFFESIASGRTDYENLLSTTIGLK